MYGKREVCGDTCICMPSHCGFAVVSVLAWDVKTKCAGEVICLWQKDLLKLNMPCRAPEALSVCEGKGM